MTPEQSVRAWHEAVARRDIDAALGYLSEDFVRLGESTSWKPISKQQWGAMIKTFLVAFPDWTWEISSMVASGDTVACEALEHGTFTQPYALLPNFTIQPNGKSFVDRDADFFRVNEAGLITELRAYITQNFEKTYRLAAQIAESGVLTGGKLPE